MFNGVPWIFQLLSLNMRLIQNKINLLEKKDQSISVHIHNILFYCCVWSAKSSSKETTTVHDKSSSCLNSMYGTMKNKMLHNFQSISDLSNILGDSGVIRSLYHLAFLKFSISRFLGNWNICFIIIVITRGLYCCNTLVQPLSFEFLSYCTSKKDISYDNLSFTYSFLMEALSMSLSPFFTIRFNDLSKGHLKAMIYHDRFIFLLFWNFRKIILLSTLFFPQCRKQNLMYVSIV